ncbi:hypothetical protein GQX73_g5010 [Xylaria multiplex]|uniref:Uncharacterized protein n=1 Tax=Xylaria multiplex TaxID=323545 RepID=A0A7C8MUU3_9PEZI|nr:hypothetical protein GQX73_g5010 [Xylaria multiplex]
MSSSSPSNSSPYLRTHTCSNPRRSYEAYFRHVNCKNLSQSENPKSCGFRTRWNLLPVIHEPHAPYTHPSTPNAWVRNACCDLRESSDEAGRKLVRVKINEFPETDKYIPPYLKPTVQLGRFAQQVAYYDCRPRDKFKPNEGIAEIAAFIIWQGEPPRDLEGRAHGSTVTLGHLEIMRQRNCGDYIQVDFTTDHPGEEERERKSMIRALAKLSKSTSRLSDR